MSKEVIIWSVDIEKKIITPKKVTLGCNLQGYGNLPEKGLDVIMNYVKSVRRHTL